VRLSGRRVQRGQDGWVHPDASAILRAHAFCRAERDAARCRAPALGICPCAHRALLSKGGHRGAELEPTRSRVLPADRLRTAVGPVRSGRLSRYANGLLAASARTRCSALTRSMARTSSARCSGCGRSGETFRPHSKRTWRCQRTLRTTCS